MTSVKISNYLSLFLIAVYGFTTGIGFMGLAMISDANNKFHQVVIADVLFIGVIIIGILGIISVTNVVIKKVGDIKI